MKRENWPVGDFGIRPVSADEQVCAYCHKPRGEDEGYHGVTVMKARS